MSYRMVWWLYNPIRKNWKVLSENPIMHHTFLRIQLAYKIVKMPLLPQTYLHIYKTSKI